MEWDGMPFRLNMEQQNFVKHMQDPPTLYPCLEIMGPIQDISFMRFFSFLARTIVTHERFLKCLSEKLVQVYASSVKV